MSTEWSAAEAASLRHEEFINEVIRRRSPPAPPQPPAPPAPWWQRFLESSGGTALITVIIGGIFGAIISGIVQLGQKEREFQQSWLKSRGDQALLAYKEHLEKQQEVVRKLYERVGVTIAAADDLLSLSKPEFAAAAYAGEQKDRMRAYRTEVRNKYNAKDAEWRHERDSLGLLINYYHPSQPGVLTSWQALKTSLTGYMRCSEKWVMEHPVSEDTANACQAERQSLTQGLEGLTASLAERRAYAWEGWESPERLRAKLDEEPQQDAPAGPAR